MPALRPAAHIAPHKATPIARRHTLLALGGLLAAARPARADDDGAATTAPAMTPPAPSTDASDSSPLVTELLARSKANKAKYDKERLDSYYRRNADALRVIDTPQLDPAIRQKIKAWLDANA